MSASKDKSFNESPSGNKDIDPTQAGATDDLQEPNLNEIDSENIEEFM